MAETIIHVGDIGTVFTLTITENDGSTAVDVSSATKKEIIFEDSVGAAVNKTASFTTDGADGKIYYTAIAGDIDMAGMWHMQGYVEMTSGKFYSGIVQFQVDNVLS